MPIERLVPHSRCRAPSMSQPPATAAVNQCPPDKHSIRAGDNDRATRNIDTTTRPRAAAPADHGIVARPR